MYFIIETQVDKNGVGNSIVTTKETRNEADSEYYKILQYAAISNVYAHAACILNQECMPLMHYAYYHNDEELNSEQ